MPELIWDGKYDAHGKRVAIPKIALPFQTVETVNEDTRARERSLNLFESGEAGDWRNRLIWGDKKWVLPSLLPEFGGQIDLIYIDPPFDTGADFSFSAPIPDDPNAPENGGQSFTKEPSLLELKAYRDIWGGAKTHLDAYLKWFYETVVVLYDLLAPTGSIYVHLDWHVGHYAKTILDEVFGAENFRNEIAWKRSSIATNVSSQWRNSHDLIFFYSKSDKNTFNVQYAEHSESSKNHYSQIDERGPFQPAPLLVSGKRNGETGKVWRGIDPNALGKSGMHWIRKPSALEEMDAQGLIYWGKEGTLPRMKFYLDQSKGRYLGDFWEDIPLINSMASESVNYNTQKPEALLERIIKASSNPGDLVLDCFCGSGTTAAVSEKLKRRWITCDLGRFAIHTARKRLLAIPDLVPFQVSNLGKYERQAWKTDSPY